jgi:hypothetical protein
MGWSFLAIPALPDTCMSAAGGYFGAKCVVDYSIQLFMIWKNAAYSAFSGRKQIGCNLFESDP